MPTQAETDAIKAYLEESPNHMDVALAVYEAWPTIVDHVCEKFMRALCDDIRQSIQQKLDWADVVVEYSYDGSKSRANWIWLYNTNWMQYEAVAAGKFPVTENRTAIVLAADANGPDSWFIAVRTPILVEHMNKAERSRRNKLKHRLTRELGGGDGENNTWYPWWRYLRDDVKHWGPLIPQLHRECEDVEQRRIRRRLVDEILGIATQAFPVIDGVEFA